VPKVLSRIKVSMVEDLIVKNKKAFHDYTILERLEAGIVLMGTEVKSIKNRNVTLKDGYCFIQNGEIFLRNVHIGKYPFGNRVNHEPLRERKLLLHKREIHKLYQKIKERGYTLVPLQIYLKNGKIKFELGLVKGKKLYDRKEEIKKKDISRDLKNNYKLSNLSGPLKH
jgi:SsrA-binding protein